MPNLERKINTHNKSTLRENPQQPERMCNCRSKPDCPLKGECLSNNVIYQATVKTNDTKKTYTLENRRSGAKSVLMYKLRRVSGGHS